MTILTKIAPWVLLAAMGSGPHALRLRVAPRATLEEATVAAQNLAARCKAYGYRGIGARVVEERDQKWVEVTSESGFTTEMAGMVRIFGAVRGASIEIRFPYERTEAEQEQYQPGADLSGDIAPPGAHWYRCWAPKHPAILLRDAPAVVKQDILLSRRRTRSGGTQLFCEISRTRTREIEKADLRRRLGTPYLLLDGLVLQPVLLERKEIDRDNKRIVPAARASFVPTGSALREVLLYPLPVALEMVSPGTPDTPTESVEPHAMLGSR